MHKVTFNSNVLKAVISRMGGVISTNPIIPILNTTLLVVDGNKATFTATDQQITMTSAIPCESEGYARVAIPISDLQDLSKAIPSGVTVEFTINVAPFAIHVKSGRATFDYSALDPVLFPKSPALDDSRIVPMDPALVLSIINCLSFCGMEPAVLWTMGVCLKGNGDKVRAIGASGHNVCESMLYDAAGIGDLSVILPKNAITTLRDLPSTNGIELVIPNMEPITNVAFRNEDATVYVRLIDSEYVNYEMIMPKDYTNGFDFNASEMLSTIRSVAVGTNNDKGGVVALTIKDLDANVASRNYADSKSGESSVELIKNNDGDVVVGFSAALLINLLSKLTGEAQALHAGVHDRPFIFTDESKDATYLLATTLLPSN